MARAFSPTGKSINACSRERPGPAKWPMETRTLMHRNLSRDMCGNIVPISNDMRQAPASMHEPGYDSIEHGCDNGLARTRNHGLSRFQADASGAACEGVDKTSGIVPVQTSGINNTPSSRFVSSNRCKRKSKWKNI
jgi:hypothetical protein